MDIKTADLGDTISHLELINQCKAIWGGVSWPGKRPGYAVVIGMGQEPHFDSYDTYDTYVMDEFECDRLPTLIRQCGVLDKKWCPDCWIGPPENDAADLLIQETKDRFSEGSFSLTPTILTEMDSLYPYIVGKLDELTHPERKRLWLKGAQAGSYLSSLDEAEESIAELGLGDYPALEALAFVVIELRDHIRIEEEVARLPQHHSCWNDNLFARGMERRRRR